MRTMLEPAAPGHRVSARAKGCYVPLVADSVALLARLLPLCLG